MSQANLCFDTLSMASCYEVFFKMDTMELDRRICETFTEVSRKIPFESLVSVNSFLSMMAEQLNLRKDDIVKQQRVIFLLLKRYFHICDQPAGDILTCPNRDVKGVCDSKQRRLCESSDRKRKLSSPEMETLSKFTKTPDVSVVAKSQGISEDVVYTYLTSCLEHGKDVDVKPLGVDTKMLEQIDYEWHQNPQIFVDLLENSVLLSPKVRQIQKNLDNSGFRGITQEKVRLGLAACKKRKLF